VVGGGRGGGCHSKVLTPTLYTTDARNQRLTALTHTVNEVHRPPRARAVQVWSPVEWWCITTVSISVVPDDTPTYGLPPGDPSALAAASGSGSLEGAASSLPVSLDGDDGATPRASGAPLQGPSGPSGGSVDSGGGARGEGAGAGVGGVGGRRRGVEESIELGLPSHVMDALNAMSTEDGQELGVGVREPVCVCTRPRAHRPMFAVVVAVVGGALVFFDAQQ
jgi:hypothetical protein